MTRPVDDAPFTENEITSLCQLFWDSSYKVYLILDRARAPEIGALIASATCKHQTLYGGKLAESLEEFGPELLEIDETQPITRTFATKGWRQAWGVFVLSRYDFETVRNQLRRLLGVELPDGGKALFRFYDPRVLRTFLPTCTKEERSSFFGNVIHSYVLEDSTGEISLEFTANTVCSHPPLQFLFKDEHPETQA
jgi:hypothetical protein